MSKKLYVGNLAFAVTNEDLAGLFAEVGRCESASVIMDRATGQSRGFGFVEMSSAEEAARAIERLNGREFHRRPVKVSEARERESRGGNGNGGRSWGRREAKRGW